MDTPTSQQPPVPQSSQPTFPEETLWDKFRKTPAFPIISIVIVAVVILGLGFAVVKLVGRVSTTTDKFAPVKGPQNVEYKMAGEAVLKLSVLKAEYRDTYGESKPMAPGRKFVVVNFEIRNEGNKPSGAFTNADMRLITPDGSIMPPAGWSAGFLNTGVGTGATKKGEVIFDIDERNAQQPLAGYQVAFGQNPGSRALYPMTPR